MRSISQRQTGGRDDEAHQANCGGGALATGMLAGPVAAQAHDYSDHDRGNGWAWGRDRDDRADHDRGRWADDDHRKHDHDHDHDRRG